jgi:hypothetical protein
MDIGEQILKHYDGNKLIIYTVNFEKMGKIHKILSSKLCTSAERSSCSSRDGPMSMIAPDDEKTEITCF